MTQKQKINKYLAEHSEGITAREALLKLGIGRLAARIHEMRKGGANIAESWEEYKNGDGETVRYKRYKVVKA